MNPAPAAGHESVEKARLLLGAAAAAGLDARQLAADARLAPWALARDRAMIPSRYSMRLWELLEHALGDPQVALTVAARHRVGDLDLYDYLFTTSPTLKDGLRASSRYLHLITTASRLQVDADAGRETTYSYRYIERGGRGEELSLQFAVAVICARATAAAGRAITPARVAFAQPAPRSQRALGEALGTSRIEFGAPVTTVTFRARDLELPLPGADPALAGILRRYAATLPPPPPATWHEHFRHLLGQAIDHGDPSITSLARHLGISPRTLQRRLAEHRTTWRSELDIARRHRAQRARQDGPADMTRLARQLGYLDPRSVRRAFHRWDRSTAAGAPRSDRPAS
jgi:AraC-like DNA-binding protein